MKKLKEYIKFVLELFAIKSKNKKDDITYQEKIILCEPNYQKKILHNQAGNDLVRDAIGNDLPIMISRLGAVELACLSFYLRSRLKNRKKYPEGIKYCMSNNAGFFPVNNKSLDKFSEFFLESIVNVDIMGVWFNDYEDSICNSYCNNAELVELGCIEPFHFKNPWSGNLEGKKVLVVHPFVESIKRQYVENRHLLFSDPEVLPDFDLKTVKAVQSAAGASVYFETWFDAYEHMCDEIKKEDFDIAIIGAGAYGLPLASFIKKMGKQAIHMGGVTQILFGIKGRRWETGYAETTGKLFNEHWIRPVESEMPAGYKNVENGCYW